MAFTAGTAGGWRDLVDHPGLVPGLLHPEDDPDARGRRRLPRSGRDWTVDVVAIAVSVASGIGLALQEAALGLGGVGLVLDVVVGLIGCGLLWSRRRWPVGTAVVLTVMSVVSVTVAVASVVALFTVAVHRRTLLVLPVALLQVLAATAYYAYRPDPDLGFWLAVWLSLALVVVVCAVGSLVRARRQMLLVWRDRAHRAEREQVLRCEQARQLERTRIAREMHDVLAHRISLVSLHAGALEFRPDAPAADISRAAGVVRENAHQALEELRQIVGVLRDVPEAGRGRPAPTLADLPELINQCRAAGAKVTTEVVLPPDPPLPDVVGRTVYRIIQEGLTNARKHAVGATVDVQVRGGPGRGVEVTVVNRPSLRPADPAVPGTGTGLVGLSERADLAGGRLDHGMTSEGDFALTAWLPWNEGRS